MVNLNLLFLNFLLSIKQNVLDKLLLMKNEFLDSKLA